MCLAVLTIRMNEWIISWSTHIHVIFYEAPSKCIIENQFFFSFTQLIKPELALLQCVTLSYPILPCPVPSCSIPPHLILSPPAFCFQVGFKLHTCLAAPDHNAANDAHSWLADIRHVTLKVRVDVSRVSCDTGGVQEHR